MASFQHKIIELDDLEKAVLQKLIFEESFENILADCKSLALPNIITDILKYLIQHKLVVAKYQTNNKNSKSGFMYDSDKMKDYTYQATARGIRHFV